MTEAVGQRSGADSDRTTRPDVLREPCRTAAAWQAADVADPAAWQFELSPAQLDELESGLRESRRNGIALLKLTRERFPLPTLAPTLERVARCLEGGPGFAVIRGLPAERYDDAELATLLWATTQYLGSPVSQDSRGRKLRRIRCATESRAGGGAADLELRTGGSDVVALLSPRLGGRSSVVSSAALYNEVLRREPVLVERLYRRFAVDRRGEELPGERPYRMLPLACWYDGELSLRYDRFDIESAQRFPAAPRLAPADLELFDLLDELAASSELRFSFDVEPGDIQLFNNYAVLHAHVQRRCRAVPAARDHVLRLWLTLHNGRRLPPGFTWTTPGYGGPRGRGGVTPSDVPDDRRPGDRSEERTERSADNPMHGTSPCRR